MNRRVWSFFIICQVILGVCFGFSSELKPCKGLESGGLERSEESHKDDADVGNESSVLYFYTSEALENVLVNYEDRHPKALVIPRGRLSSRTNLDSTLTFSLEGKNSMGEDFSTSVAIDKREPFPIMCILHAGGEDELKASTISLSLERLPLGSIILVNLWKGNEVWFDHAGTAQTVPYGVIVPKLIGPSRGSFSVLLGERILLTESIPFGAGQRGMLVIEPPYIEGSLRPILRTVALP